MESKKEIFWKTFIYEVVVFFIITSFMQFVLGISFFTSVGFNIAIIVGRIGSRYFYDIYWSKIKKLI